MDQFSRTWKSDSARAMWSVKINSDKEKLGAEQKELDVSFFYH